MRFRYGMSICLSLVILACTGRTSNLPFWSRYAQSARLWAHVGSMFAKNIFHSSSPVCLRFEGPLISRDSCSLAVAIRQPGLQRIVLQLCALKPYLCLNSQIQSRALHPDITRRAGSITSTFEFLQCAVHLVAQVVCCFGYPPEKTPLHVSPTWQLRMHSTPVIYDSQQIIMQ